MFAAMFQSSRWRLCGHARSGRDGVIPTLQHAASRWDGHAERTCREVDRHQRGDVRRREVIARDEGNLRQPGVDVVVEVRHPKLTAFDERRDLRNVSMTLIQPGSEFKLGFLGSPSVAGGSCCRGEEVHLWICGQRKGVDHKSTGAAATKRKT